MSSGTLFFVTSCSLRGISLSHAPGQSNRNALLGLVKSRLVTASRHSATDSHNSAIWMHRPSARFAFTRPESPTPPCRTDQPRKENFHVHPLTHCCPPPALLCCGRSPSICFRPGCCASQASGRRTDDTLSHL